jgi:hypothetical protein
MSVVQVSSTHGSVPPQVSLNEKSLMNDRDSLLRKYRKTKDMEDVFNAYKQKRNLVTSKLRHAKSAYNKNLLEENFDKPRSF